MNRTRKMLKKMTAGIAASALVLSGSSTVLAAESYQEAEKAALEKFISSTEEYLDDYAESYEKAQTGSKATLTLTAEDAGKSLLGMMTGMDFSWLNTISMDMDVTIKDSVEATAIDFLVNDSVLCTMNALIDTGNLAEYLQIPELSETWMEVPLTFSSTDGSGVDISAEGLQFYYDFMSDFMNMMPDSATVGTLLDRYGNLIIDNLTEEASVDEAVSVEGISEDCTLFEAQITESGFYKMLNQILTTAKDDQELKSVFDTWADVGSSTGDLYTEFQSAVDGLLSEVSEDAGSDTAILISKIWTNEEGKIVGREIDAVDGTENVPVFTWKNPSQDGNSALTVEISDGTDSLALTGSGQIAEGLLNGNYVVAYNGVQAANLTVENLETEPEKPGYVNGSITVSFPNNGSEESPNPLAGFGAVINMSADASAETSQMDISLTSSGAPLATLSIAGGYGEGAEITDPSSLGTTLNISNEEDIIAYLQGMNWSGLLDNARAAGIPEELVTQIDAAIQSVVENALNPAADSADDEQSEGSGVENAESADSEAVA